MASSRRERAYGRSAHARMVRLSQSGNTPEMWEVAWRRVNDGVEKQF